MKGAGRYLPALLGMAVLAMAATPAAAEGIRFYKVNSKGQQSEVGFLRNRDEPGCHNILGSREIFRVAQVGFTYCAIYAEEDCPEGGAMVMHWKGRVKKNSARAQPTDRLMPGDLWYFEDNGTRTINSWMCQR